MFFARSQLEDLTAFNQEAEAPPEVFAAAPCSTINTRHTSNKAFLSPWCLTANSSSNQFVWMCCDYTRGFFLNKRFLSGKYLAMSFFSSSLLLLLNRDRWCPSSPQCWKSTGVLMKPEPCQINSSGSDHHSDVYLWLSTMSDLQSAERWRSNILLLNFSSSISIPAGPSKKINGCAGISP